MMEKDIITIPLSLCALESCFTIFLVSKYKARKIVLLKKLGLKLFLFFGRCCSIKKNLVIKLWVQLLLLPDGS